MPSDRNFDALIIGYYEEGKLFYVGRTRNGFTPPPGFDSYNVRNCSHLCLPWTLTISCSSIGIMTKIRP